MSVMSRASFDEFAALARLMRREGMAELELYRDGRVQYVRLGELPSPASLDDEGDAFGDERDDEAQADVARVLYGKPLGGEA